MALTNVRVDIPEAFEPLLDPYRYKVFYGGRGSAKSWSFATVLSLRCAEKPLRVLCARDDIRAFEVVNPDTREDESHDEHHRRRTAERGGTR